MKTVALILAVLAAVGWVACRPPATPPGEAPQGGTVESPPRAACHVGDENGSLSVLEPSDAIHRVAELDGRLVRVRGYFSLAFELNALVNRTGSAALALELQLPAATSIADLEACRHSLVTLQGTLTRTTRRGKEVVVLRAEAMSESTEVLDAGASVAAATWPDSGGHL